MSYTVLSPDGLPIDDTCYPTEEAAVAALARWVRRYTVQGYYAAARERITLEALPTRCQVLALRTPSSAVCKREMHFESGPHTHTFYACAAHKPALEAGDVMCFLLLTNRPVEPLDADEQLDAEAEMLPCYFCQEG